MLGAGGMPASFSTDLYSSLQAGRAYIAVLKNRCRNGDHYWADVYFTPIYDQGKLAGIESIRTQAEPECIARAKKIYPKLQATSSRRSLGDLWMQQGLHIKLGLVLSAMLTIVFGSLAVCRTDVRQS